MKEVSHLPWTNRDALMPKHLNRLRVSSEALKSVERVGLGWTLSDSALQGKSSHPWQQVARFIMLGCQAGQKRFYTTLSSLQTNPTTLTRLVISVRSLYRRWVWMRAYHALGVKLPPGLFTDVSLVHAVELVLRPAEDAQLNAYKCKAAGLCYIVAIESVWFQMFVLNK
jgi:hypothetical protein